MKNESDYQTFMLAVRDAAPDCAIVLGSGLGGVLSEMVERASIAYPAIPGMVMTSVAGHAGRLTLGHLGERNILIFRGRFHYYEGHRWEQVIRPVQVAAECGVRTFIATNAAGGIADPLVPGSLMTLRGHRWFRLDRAETTVESCYSADVRAELHRAAASVGVMLHTGVYGTVTGPCYETPAEIRAMQRIGIDAVGMSTAREMEAGAELGLRCAAISCITNRAAGLSDGPLHHQEVIDTATSAADRLSAVLTRFLLG